MGCRSQRLTCPIPQFPVEVLNLLVRKAVTTFPWCVTLADVAVEGCYPAVFLPPMLDEVDTVIDVEGAGGVGIDAEDPAVVVDVFHPDNPISKPNA